MNKYNELLYMTRDEAAEAFKRYPVAVLPLGATEQHGHHLPNGVDIFLAEALSRRVCEQTGATMLPTMPFGYSWVWRDIPGTVSLQQQHVEAVIKDVAHSVARYGTKLLVLINGHDANNASMKYATRELEDELEMKVIHMFYPNLSSIIEKYCDSGMWHGMIHACEFETSLMLAVKPEYVQMEKAVREYPEKPNLYGKSTISLGELSQSGVYGDATLATKEKGELMLRLFVEEMTPLVDEAYQQTIADRGEHNDSTNGSRSI